MNDKEIYTNMKEEIPSRTLSTHFCETATKAETGTVPASVKQSHVKNKKPGKIKSFFNNLANCGSSVRHDN